MKIERKYLRSEFYDGSWWIMFTAYDGDRCCKAGFKSKELCDKAIETYPLPIRPEPNQ